MFIALPESLFASGLARSMHLCVLRLGSNHTPVTAATRSASTWSMYVEARCIFLEGYNPTSAVTRKTSS